MADRHQDRGLPEFLRSLSALERSAWVRQKLKAEPEFEALAHETLKELNARDLADETALALGVRHSVDRGILPAAAPAISWRGLIVGARTPESVAREVDAIVARGGADARLVAVAGNSGVGKGTTVSALAALNEKYVTWSNGDVFRFIAFLALAHGSADVESTVRLIANSLIVDQDRGVLSTTDGVSLTDVGRSVLHGAKISSLVPAVARFAQGEVINLLASAAASMERGRVLIVEGRRITLEYAGPDIAVELKHGSQWVLAERRAAQRIADAVVENMSSDRLALMIDRLSDVSPTRPG